MVYITLILPGISDFRCGPSYNAEWETWYDPDGNDKSGDEPACDDGVIPYERGDRLHQIYRIMVDFLPLLVLASLLFLVFKQSGNVGMLPAFALAIIVRELIPGDGIVDWAVMLIGIILACIPIPMSGLFAALSHAGAFALWPTVIMVYSAASKAVESEISSSVMQVFEFAVWVVPLGLLIFIPIRWGMSSGEGATI